MTGTNDTVSPSMRARYPVLHLPDRSATVPPSDAKAAPTSKVTGFDRKTSKEQVERRGRTTAVFTNADGTETTVYSQSPLNFKDDKGQWQAVTPGLDKAGAGGWAGTGDGVDVALPQQVSATSGPSIDLGDATVSWSLRGARQVSGRAVTTETDKDAVQYSGVLDGVDLTLEPVPGGVKESLVLASRAVPRTYDFDLDTGGLTAHLSQGSIELVDGKDVVRAVIPAGFMTDAGTRQRPAETSSGVTYSLHREGRGTVLRLTLDDAWLDAGDRAFPVVVDPDVLQKTASSAVTVRDSDTVPGGTELSVGVRNGVKSAAYLAFPDVSTELRYHRIFGAALYAASYDAPSCTPRPVTVHAVTQAWSASDTSLRYPGPSFTSSALDSESMAYGYVPFGASQSACPVQMTGWELGAAGRDLVQSWVNTPSSNKGLTLRASATDTSAFKHIAGSSSANAPRLYVTHSPYDAKYSIPNPTPDPAVLQNQAGKVKISVTNTSAMDWTAADYYLAYTAYDAVSNKVMAQNTAASLPTGGVARLASVTLDAQILAMPVGRYIIDFTMMRKGVGSFVAQNVAPARLLIEVFNLPPVLKEVYPPNGYASPNLTPELWGEATDIDGPVTGLTYNLTVWPVNTDGSLGTPFSSGYLSSFSWVVPSGKLAWNRTYRWQAQVKDALGAVTTGPMVTLLTDVPQPVLSSASTGGGERPYDVSTGAFTTAAVDAPVSTVGPELTIRRTYNSHDSRSTGAFGAGWATRYDMRVVEEASGSLLATLQDGTAARFGRNADGTYSGPRAQSMSIVKTTTGYDLKDTSGTTYLFSTAGLLAFIKPPLGATTQLTYVSGKLSQIKSLISSRALTFTWTGAHVTSVKTDLVNGAALEWKYTYTGDSLTSVCGPDGGCTTYATTPVSLYRTAVGVARPDSVWRFGEAAGTTALSDVGVNLGKDHATYTNVTLGGAGAIAGSGNTSARIVGASSSVGLPKGIVRRNRQLGVELWFKLDALNTTSPLVGYQGSALTSAQTSGVPLLYVGSDGKVRGQFATGTIAPITSATAIADLNWHHVVLQAAGSTQSLWLDGVKVGTLTGTPNHALLEVAQIGAANATGTWPAYGTGLKHLAGSVDEAALYSSSLSDDDIRSHYALGRAPTNVVSSVTLPTGRKLAGVRYDPATARVTEYADQFGSSWWLSAPTYAGTDTDLRRTVMVSDPASRASFYEYDGLNGRLLRTGTPTGVGVRPEDSGLPSTPGGPPTTTCPTPSPEDPSFCIIQPGQDGGSYVIQPTEGIAVRTYYYNADGLMARVVNEVGSWVDLTYDARGNVTSRKSCTDRAAGACATSYTTYGSGFTNPLDPRWDKPTEQRDGRSASATDTAYRTLMTYTSTGQPWTQTSPDGGVTTTAYTNGAEGAVGGGTMPPGLPSTVTDPRNQITRIKYTAKGDLAEVTEPSGLRTTYVQDALGRKISQTEYSSTYPAGLTTTYTYDKMSRLLTETSPATTDAVTGVKHQRRTTTTYDLDGNVVSTKVEDLLGGDLPRTTTFEFDDAGRAVKVVDPEGHETQYGYDRFGNRLSMTDASGRRYEYAYTTRNQLAEVRMRDGSATGYTVLTATTYDTVGREVKSVDAMGHAVTRTYNDDDSVRRTTLLGYHKPDGTTSDLVLEEFTYDKAGNVTKVVGAGGEDVTTKTYDAVGRVLTQVSDPAGLARTQAMTYDKGGNVLSVIQSGRSSNVPWAVAATSQTTTYTYNTVGQRTAEQVTTAAGAVRKSTFAYDTRGLLVSSVSPRGNVTGADPLAFTTTVTNDELGRTYRTERPARAVETNGSAPASTKPVSLAGFNTFDEVTSTKDESGRVVSTTFDKVGNPKVVTMPSYTAPGGAAVTPSITYEYDALGNVLRQIDPLGRATSYVYDALNRVTSRTDPASGGGTATWRYEYTPTGQVSRTIDPLGAVNEATYDDLGRQITATRVERQPVQANFVSRYEYTPGGRLLSTTTPTGAKSSYAYDTLGQVTSSTDPNGVVTRMGYDYTGNVIRSSDGLGRTSKSTFDLTGELTAIADLDAAYAPLRTQAYTYDAEGNMLTSTNPGGRSTTYTYDASGSLVQQVEPVTDTTSITTSFGYDASGRNTRYTDGRGNRTLMTYNVLGTLESVIEPSTVAHPGASDRTWTAAYDAAGQAVRLTAPGGLVRTRTYDEAGRLARETGSGAEAATPDRVFGYDAVGRMVKASTPRGDDTYSYDDAGNLLTAAGPSGSASFSYDEDGQLVRRTDAAGQSAFAYTKGRLTSVTDGITGTTQALAYDASGEVASVDYGSGRTRSFGYDNLRRLSTDIVKNASNAVVSSIEYGYDLQNNVTSKKTRGFGTAEDNTYTYDQANRLTSWAVGGVSTLYEWDASGNRTREGSKVATYDERNRLLSDGTYTYAYTARGTLKSRSSAQGTTSLTFDAFDRMVADGGRTYTYDALDRIDSAAGTTMTYAGQSNDLVAAGTAKYARGPGGGLVAASVGVDQRLMLTDQHGDVVGGFRPDDTTLAGLSNTRSYAPHGAVRASTGLDIGLGFQGDWTDPSSGKVSMGARWYDPSTGGFASRDSASYSGGDSVLANKYTYAAANPVTLFDPDGHWPSCGWCSKAVSSVRSAVSTVSSAASSAWRATSSAVSYGWNTAYHYASSAYNWVRNTVSSVASKVWNGVKAAASWVYEKGRSAYNFVAGAVSRGWSMVKSAVSSGYQWAKQQAAAAAQRVYEAKVRVTAATKAAVRYAVQHNPLPAIKAALKPVMNGIKAVTKAALALPAAAVQLTKDVVKASAVAAEQIYQQAVATAGQVVREVSKAASAVTEFVVENKAAIAGLVTGIAVTAGCMAGTFMAGSAACIVAGMAAGNAVMSALSCPAGRSVVGCAARGAAVGAVAGVITVASGGTMTGLVVGGAIASGASTALDAGLSGEQASAGDILKSAAIGGLTAGVGSKLGGALGKLRSACRKNSFTAATRVLMADGTLKEIRRVALGDVVRATDARTGKSSARLVTNLIQHTGVRSMVAITLVAGGTVHATAEHPIYEVGQKDFVVAKALRSGSELRLDDGSTATVAAAAAYTENLTAYNFTVDVDHTYYVSDGAGNDVLVHNSDLCSNAVSGQVPLGSEGLASKAAEFRTRNGVSPKANVAVFEFERNGEVGHMVAQNVPRGAHAEEVLDGWVDAMGMDRSSVTGIYSERVPCASAGHECASVVGKYPAAALSFSLPGGDGRASFVAIARFMGGR